MNNKELAACFKLTGQLMELHGENKFKVRSYGNAAFQIGRYSKPIVALSKTEVESIPGVGKNLAPKLIELMETENMSYLNQWLEKTPSGVVEMLKIKGLGPSKISTIWHEMGIESMGEILYACNENRLIELKGFGEKTQTQVRESIEFLMAHSHSFLFASIETLIAEIKNHILDRFPNAKVSETGAALRRDNTLDKIEVVVNHEVNPLPDFSQSHVPVELICVQTDHFDTTVFEKSLGQAHREMLGNIEGKSAKEVYAQVGIDVIVPEMRDANFAINWAKKYSNSDLISNHRLKGCLHNHSTYSDGLNTLDEMANYLLNQGYSYFGICDHSKSAAYAGGLSEAQIIQQHEEIDILNDKLQPFRILKGIESDILPNGDLDYDKSVLSTFDFVVASIHSVMKMDEQTATARIIKAIENPHTSILGHPTGRLLLSRPGYPIDHIKVIDACAANKVAVELNSNPMRLDIDHTWIPYCMEKGVMVSINPDAHRIEGFDHIRYGVMSARKGGLTVPFTLNALPLEKLMSFFQKSN